MKQLLLLIAILLLLLCGCKKDSILPDLSIGQTYRFNEDIFNTGAYQPVNSMQLDSLYIDPISGLPYAQLKAKINWAQFATDTKHGAAQMIVDGNMATLKQLRKIGIDIGYSLPIEWQFPQKDLRK